MIGRMSTFVLLVPVKTLARAKTRLSPRPDRDLLMRAFALDALAAVRASAAVAHTYVVSDEDGFGETIGDEGDGDLNLALRVAEREVRLRHPGLAVAALLADLPALRTSDLDAALGAGLHARWYVADADGTGTTLLAAGPGTDLDPRFGAGSAARHEVSGAVPVRAEVPTLRRDVDTDTDLRAAVALGVGRHTRDALEAPRP
jgi:2-phospho-L-lactate guanylyltransferase